MAKRELIIGGARSGKSALAEQRAGEGGLRKIYLATAEAGDAEMQQRIEHHRSKRSVDWLLVEEPVNLADAIRQHQGDDTVILVDCLTLWLSNCLHKGNWRQQRQEFLDTLDRIRGQIILVSNEVGSGVIPMAELSRQFVDESGFLHQQLGRICDQVTLVAAGLPLQLKPVTTGVGDGC